MDQHLRAAASRLAADAESGASELLPRAIGLLREARKGGPAATLQAARAVCAAQPSMGSFWNAALAALTDLDRPGTLESFDERARRAGAALVRFAVELLAEPGDGVTQPEQRLVTFSFSGSVLAVIRALAEHARATVGCAEGRPRLEGRRLATALAAAGIGVEFYTDAALGSIVAESDAVLLGADAITPHWFLNKCGTSQLAAAASWSGVPVFLIASRDKFVPAPVAPLLTITERQPAEVWDVPPAGVVVRNLYFERVPLDHVTAIVTDAGVLGGDMVEEACRANGTAAGDEVLRVLIGS